MRILRLDVEQGQTGVDLHPFLTIAQQLGPEQRAELITAIRSLAQGSTAGIRGLLQHQGLLVELDGGGDDRLGVLTGADVVIDTELTPFTDLPRLQAEIDQQQRRAEIDAVTVEEVRADLDPSARSRVAALEDRLDPGDEAATARRRQDVTRVSTALERLRRLEPTLREAPEGVVALRQRLERYQARVVAAEAHFSHLEAAVAQSEARLEAARRALADREAATRPVLLTRDEEARLELLSFPGMDETRRGRWRKMLRPEEEAEKQALLAKVGVESWTAYTVYRVDPVAPAVALAAAEAAQRAFEEASVNLEETRAELSTDPLTVELNQELLDIRRAGRSHLGLMLPPDLDRALAELVVERTNPEHVAALERLRQLLIEVGVEADLSRPVEGGMERAAQLTALARSWLDRQLAAERDQADDDLRTDLARARRALDRHRRALARIGRAEAAAGVSAAELARLRVEAERRVAGGPPTADTLLSQVGLVATQVAVDARGSLPVVMVGEFSGLDDDDLRRVLERCSQLAGGLQVIVITDRPAATAWATGAGLGQALVVRPKPLDDSVAPSTPL